MTKYYLVLFKLWSIVAIALGLGSYQKAFADTDDVTIYGSVIDAGEGANGIYSFNTLKPGILTPVKISENLSAQGGGVLAGDCYYSIHADDKTLHVYDADVWEERYSTKITNVALDMAYDPTTEQVYGCFVDGGPKLGILKPKEGTYEQIGAMTYPVAMMVCTADGNLFAVANDGILYSVDKSSGDMYIVGSTQITPMFAQSATIDPNTGKCYWVSVAPDTSSCLVELNLLNGEPTWIYDFPSYEEITGLFILPEINEGAPAKPENVVYNKDAKTVTFNAPTKTYGGSSLSNDLLECKVKTYTLENDETMTNSFKMNPGEKKDYYLSDANGMVKISVSFSNAKGEGDKSFLFFWMGEDNAGAVENLTVEKESALKARISWETPKEGEHGGDYDKSSLKYTVVRYPEGVVVAENVQSTSVTDEVTETELKKYWYEVTPYTGSDKKGVTSKTEEIIMGNSIDLPYNEPFDLGAPNTDNGHFNTFTVYDNNKDEETWYLDTWAGKVKYAGNSEKKADDWLITPPIRIEGGSICSFSFRTTVGFVGFYTVHKFEVAMGNKPGIKDMNVQLMPATEYKSTGDEGVIVKVKFEAKTTDDYYFGIHLVSDGRSMEASVDDINIVKNATVEGPAGVSDMNVVPGVKGTLSADISFKAPTSTYNGKVLDDITKVEVYRNDELIKEFGNVKPGDELSLQDTPEKSGLYTYKAVAYSNKGAGDETEVKVFVGVDVPAEVQNISMSEDEDNKVTIAWDAPVLGKNGGYIDSSKLKYTVLRNGWKAIANDISELSAVDPMDDLPAGTQNVVQYLIKVSSDEGIGDEAYSSFITVGKPYGMPFKESFPKGMSVYQPWSTMPTMTGCVWRNDYYDGGEPYDDDKGMMAYTSMNSEPLHSMLLSPKISIADAVKPLLSFWMENSAIDDDLKIEIWSDNKPVEMVKNIDLRSKRQEWTNVTVDLTPYIDNSSIQFALHITNAVKGDKLYIDNISITDDLMYNLEASDIKAPMSMKVGEEGELSLSIINRGKETADNYTVEFYDDDRLLQTVNGTPVAAGETTVVKTVMTPQVTNIGEMHISAVIKYEADENTINNTSDVTTVKVTAPTYPVVTDLTATSTDNGNELKWSAPDLSYIAPDAVTEDFESYESFTVDNFGDWTMVDVDKNEYSMEFRTNTNSWITYPNSGGKMAFQVIDLTKVIATSDDGWNSTSGDKFLICPYSSSNEDWLISPELYQMEQEIVIHAKSLNFGGYGLEGFTLLYSTTDKETSSFKELATQSDIPESWSEYRFTLPADAKYFAIRATNVNSALFIDDITYVPVTAAPKELKVMGYNVYRDGQRLGDTVTETSYIDADVENLKEYTYTVTVMYDLGESNFSNEVVVTTTTDIRDAQGGTDVYVKDGNIVISGADNMNVMITDMNGVVVANITAKNMMTVPVQQGAYIIKIGNRAYKVMVR